MAALYEPHYLLTAFDWLSERLIEQGKVDRHRLKRLRNLVWVSLRQGRDRVMFDVQEYGCGAIVCVLTEMQTHFYPDASLSVSDTGTCTLTWGTAVENAMYRIDQFAKSLQADEEKASSSKKAGGKQSQQQASSAAKG